VAIIGLALATGCSGARTPDAGGERGTIVFGRGADSDRLDPARTTSGESVKVTINVFDSLLQFKQGSTEVEPALAEEWQISDDGLEYTFKLRKGVKFHDGTPFNADAVVFSFERQMDENHEYFYDDMAYAGFTLEPVKEIVKLDDHTVKFVLKNPYAPFLRNLAMFSCAIVSPTALKKYGDDFFKNPVGTGPFVFEKWERDSQIVLRAYDDYWGGAPKVERVVFKVIPENSVRLAEVETGNVHIMDGLDPNDVKRVEDNPDLKLYSMPGLNISYMAFPCDKKPFDNVKLRRAISLAINREYIATYLYKGAAEPAEGPVPKTILDYEAEGGRYDPDEAKELLAEAGFPDGLEVTLWCYPNPRAYNPSGAKLAEAIASDLEKIGIDAEIQTMEWTSYLARSKSPEYFDGPFCLGWMGDNGDVDNFLYALLSSDNIPGGNRSRYSNPAVDSLLLQAQQLSDESKRADLYRKAVKQIVADAPWAFLTHTQDMVVTRANVEGFVQSPLTLFYLRDVALK